MPITPRQHYKAAIMQGFILSMTHEEADSLKGKSEVRKSFSSSCGQVADAMLAEDMEHESKTKTTESP